MKVRKTIAVVGTVLTAVFCVYVGILSAIEAFNAATITERLAYGFLSILQVFAVANTIFAIKTAIKEWF